LLKAKENTQNPKISGVILELLGRFELPTSSLPKANYIIIRKDMRHNIGAQGLLSAFTFHSRTSYKIVQGVYM